MKYTGMPMGMWMLFHRSFTANLKEILHLSEQESKKTEQKAKNTYRKIIEKLPVFEKEDRFQMNIVSCAMLCAYCLNLPGKPSLNEMSEYYRHSMMTKPMHFFCRISAGRKFTELNYAGMKKTAQLNAADRNPYSWNMEFYPYPDGSGYEARFTKCGICTLMKELGLGMYIPAMCRLDYTMSEAGGRSTFIREYTLAEGGPYCDCGYKKK